MSSGLDPIVVPTPDGTEHEFPAGTSPVVIRGAIASYMAQKSGAPTPAQEAIQPNPINPLELGIDAATAIPGVVRTLARAPLTALATGPLKAAASHELPQALGSAASRVLSGGKGAIGRFLARRIPLVHTLADLHELVTALKGGTQVAKAAAPEAATAAETAAEEAVPKGMTKVSEHFRKLPSKGAPSVAQGEGKVAAEIVPAKGSAASRVAKAVRRPLGGPAFTNPNQTMNELEATQRTTDFLKQRGITDPAVQNEVMRAHRLAEELGPDHPQVRALLVKIGKMVGVQ